MGMTLISKILAVTVKMIYDKENTSKRNNPEEIRIKDRMISFSLVSLVGNGTYWLVFYQSQNDMINITSADNLIKRKKYLDYSPYLIVLLLFLLSNIIIWVGITVGVTINNIRNILNTAIISSFFFSAHKTVLSQQFCLFFYYYNHLTFGEVFLRQYFSKRVWITTSPFKSPELFSVFRLI